MDAPCYFHPFMLEDLEQRSLAYFFHYNSLPDLVTVSFVGSLRAIAVSFVVKELSWNLKALPLLPLTDNLTLNSSCQLSSSPQSGHIKCPLGKLFTQQTCIARLPHMVHLINDQTSLFSHLKVDHFTSTLKTDSTDVESNYSLTLVSLHISTNDKRRKDIIRPVY